MAAVAVHVVYEDVVSAGYGDTVVLVDDDAVTDLGIVGRSEVEAWKSQSKRLAKKDW